jgi:hypothetical protein
MLSFIFFIIIFVFVLGLVIILSVLGFIRSLFSFGKRNKSVQNEQYNDFVQPEKKQKIFDKKEGEYVDFEEVE